MTTSLGKAISSSDFFIPPAPFTAADVEFTARMAIGGTQTITINTSAKKGLVVFDGVVGQRICLQFTNTTIGYANTYLYKPDGVLLVSGSAQPNDGFIDTQVLPVSGTYTVMVAPINSYTGSTTLVLREVPPDITGPITAGGPSVPLTIASIGQNAVLSFNGTAGQRISLNSTNISITGSYISIYKPDGTALVSPKYTYPLDNFIDTQTLSASGTYTILMDPVGIYTGNITLTLYLVPADVTGTITPGGAPVTVTITTPGQKANLTFAGVVGKRHSLKQDPVNSPGSMARIYSPTSTYLGDTGIVTDLGFIDTFQVSEAGTHTVQLRPSRDFTGNITVTLYDVPADVTGTLNIGGASKTVTISTPGQNGRWTFSGTSGQQVTVHVTNNTMSTVTVKLLKPDQTQLTASTLSSSSFNLATQTLPVTGTYAIVIDPVMANTGSLKVSASSP